MAGNTSSIDDHVGALLSGYIDGELTQQERQRVEIHCEACTDCSTQREALGNLRKQVGQAQLSEFGEDKWRETMDETTVRATRGIGWLLVIGGLLAVGGIAVYGFITDPGIELHLKLIIGAIYGGAAVLLFSVLRQRLIERKSDKYKDVEI